MRDRHRDQRPLPLPSGQAMWILIKALVGAIEPDPI
jgi:hypothetical protein